MSAQIHDKLVQHPSAWCGRHLVNDPWLVHFTLQDLAEIAAAVRGVKAHGLALGDAFRPHNGYGENQIAEVAFQPSVSA